MNKETSKRLRGLDLTKYLRRIGIYDELDIPYGTKQFMLKARINKEMPKIIITSTPNLRDIDNEMSFLELESRK